MVRVGARGRASARNDDALDNQGLDIRGLAIRRGSRELLDRRGCWHGCLRRQSRGPQKSKRRPKFPHAFSQYSATEADFFQVVPRTSQLTSLLMTDSHAAECRQAVPMRCLRPWQRRSSRSPTTIPARSSSSRGCRANPGRLGSIGSRRAACAPCGRPSPAAPHRMPRAAPCAGRAAPPRSQC